MKRRFTHLLRSFLQSASLAARYGLAVGLALLGSLGPLSLSSLSGPLLSFLTFAPAILVSGWMSGTGPGLVTCLAGAAFVYPVFAAQPLGGTFLFLAAGGLIAWLASGYHRSRIQVESGHRTVSELLDSMDDGFAAVDSQWRITYLNAGAERIIASAKGAARSTNPGKDRSPDLAR